MFFSLQMNKPTIVGSNKLNVQMRKDEIKTVNSPIPANASTQIAIDSRIANFPSIKDGAIVTHKYSCQIQNTFSSDRFSPKA